MPCPVEEKCLVKFETNFFKFLNIKEVFYMDWRFIINVDDGSLHGGNVLYYRWALILIKARVCVSKIENEDFFL